ncbi:MAG: hypothetical protein VB962_02205 [Pseudohongiellaceae bacterium]
MTTSFIVEDQPWTARWLSMANGAMPPVRWQLAQFSAMMGAMSFS